MKIIIVTVNVRECFGEPAKAAVVGAYEISPENDSSFASELESISRESRELPAAMRASHVQERLSGFCRVDADVAFIP